MYVEESILEEFVEKVVKRTSNICVGDPTKADTQMGALISEQHLNKVLSYVELGKKEVMILNKANSCVTISYVYLFLGLLFCSQGAQVLCGGQRLSFDNPKIANGFYMSPCIMSECTDDMRIAKEEIFGPVMMVMPFKNEEEAIRRANNTEFGLAGGVFTR